MAQASSKDASLVRCLGFVPPVGGPWEPRTRWWDNVLGGLEMLRDHPGRDGCSRQGEESLGFPV